MSRAGLPLAVRAAPLLGVFACGPRCEVSDDGPWTATGGCFGLARTLDAAWDDKACTVAFSDWQDADGTEPSGATVEEDVATFADGVLDGCTGQVDADGIRGTCTDDCAFELGPAR